MLEDARFVLRTMQAALQSSARQHHVPSLALLPTFSLATFETRRWLSQHFPEAAAELPTEGAHLVETVRNASKWVDAARGKPDVALGRFGDVVSRHAAEFLGNARFRWLQRFETDLGVYRCGGVDVLSTHAIGLLLGQWAEPSGGAGVNGNAVREAAANMSLQASALADGHALAQESFVDTLAPFTMHDVRSAGYYGTVSEDGRSTLGGYVHLLHCSLAWASMMHASSEDERGAAFKFRFLALYHAASSLSSLNVAIPSGCQRLLFNDPARTLRNELVHYNPHHATPLSAMQPDQPRVGLVQHAFQRSFAEIEADVADSITELRSALSEKLAAGGKTR